MRAATVLQACATGLGESALAAIPHCFRRSAVDYWRPWTPAPRRELLQISLRVKEARTARVLSCLLTARSDGLFSLWMSGRMNKVQLLDYLHGTLKENRPQASTDGLDLLSRGLAARLLATKGLTAGIAAADRVTLDRVWGQPDLADMVSADIAAIRRKAPDLQDFVDQSIAASLGAGLEPTGKDAEAAARIRWLAEAWRALQAARRSSRPSSTDARSR